MSARKYPLATLTIVVALAVSAQAATGGPDSFGYSWADSDEFNVTTIIPAYDATDLRGQGFVGDESVIRIDLPAAIFSTGFPFYGQNYQTLWLSSNGWLSFIDPLGDARPVPASVPAGVEPNAVIAFFWDDWTLDHIASLATAGPNDANDGYTILVRVAHPVMTTIYAQVAVTLFANGEIKFVYRRAADTMPTPSTVIGIEDEAGAVGLPFMVDGVPLHGAEIGDPSAVRFYPDGALNCAVLATPVPCPLVPTSFDSSAAVNVASRYNCAVGGYDAGEMMFELSLDAISNVTIELTDLNGLDLYAFLLREQCNENTSCIRGGATLLEERFLTPGTYYVVVDGLDPDDNGTFTLEVTCSDAVTDVACPTTLFAHVTSGQSAFDTWSCASGLTGPENIYGVTLAAPANLIATLSNKSEPGLEVLISEASSFDAAAPSCLRSDPQVAQLAGAPPGEYLITVDGAGVAGTYDLTIECRRDLQCPAPGKTIDPFDPTPVAGDTTGAANRVETYACESSGFGTTSERGGFDGPEDIYEFTLSSQASVAFLFSSADPDMRLFLLRDCYEGSCVMEGGCAYDLPAGDYWLVVDGEDGAMGAYTITPLALPPALEQRWTDCPECVNGCGQPANEVRSTRWSFDSGNYCGTGCDFSMYAVIECGTRAHLPLFDVETGHLRVFDVLRGADVELEVDNGQLVPGCELGDAGTYVAWEDEGCSASPCPTADCGGGDDCQSNNTTMDVRFAREPTACGVYRLDFLNWGGFTWELYANCTGTQLEQFYLYPDLCSALANFRPLPEVGIVDVTVDNADCGGQLASGTITLENLACAPAEEFEIVIQQEPPAPANPKKLLVSIPPEGSAVYGWSYDLTAVPGSLSFQVDPDGVSPECSESSGDRVGCGGAPILERTVPMAACTCLANEVPQPVGNTLVGVRVDLDARFQWVPLPPEDISAHRLYKDDVRGLPSASRIKVRDVSAAIGEALDPLALTDALQPLAYYQVIGVSCQGDLEGPY